MATKREPGATKRMSRTRSQGAGSLLARARGGKLLLGMVHLAPLPGSPAYDGEPLEELVLRARRDAEVLLRGGMDGYVVENFGDAPFFSDQAPPHVLAVMTRVALGLPAERDGRGARPLLRGVNVLRNDALGALAVAAAAEFDFIRVNVHCGAMVTDQGIIEGRAAETLRARLLLGARVAILADVLVKHAVPLGGGSHDAAALARELVERGRADGVIVSGRATGAPVDQAMLEAAREGVGRALLLVGSGATPDTIGSLLRIADGAIVGTSLKAGGRVDRPVDLRRVQALVRAARGK